MKYFLPSILIFSMYALFFVPTQAQENKSSVEKPSVAQTEEGVEQKIGNACLEPDENCDSEELIEKRALGREEFRTNVQSRLATIRARTEERRANSSQVRVKQEVQQRIEFSLDQTMAQFESAINKLSGIADKLENRLTVMHEQGFDVELRFEALDEARREIALSTEAIDGIARSVDEALSSDTPGNVRTALLASLKEARASLRNAHGALLQAVVSSRLNIRTNEGTSEQADVSQ